MTEENQTELNEYPLKPDDSTTNDGANRLVSSLLLSVLAFYFISGKQIDSTLILIGCLLFHELGHFLAMKFYGYNDTKIYFVPFFGALTTGKKEEVSQKQHTIILLSGPLPGIIIGLCLFYFNQNNDNGLLTKIWIMLLGLNLFNLLPVYPLDGGKIFNTLFFEKSKILSRIFMLVSIVLFVFVAIKQHDYFLYILPLFIVLQLVGQIDLEKVKRNVSDLRLRTSISYSELTNEEYWQIRDEIGRTARAFSRIVSPGIYELSDKEDRVISFIKEIIRKPIDIDLSIIQRFFVVVVWAVSFILPLFILLTYFRLI